MTLRMEEHLHVVPVYLLSLLRVQLVGRNAL